ncbi:MAG TPA: hypothetical protein VFZ69_15065 [Longimicrobiales bacterium]
MREADFDRAIALTERMAPDLRTIPDILLIRDYYTADAAGRAAVLAEIRDDKRTGVLWAALHLADLFGTVDHSTRIVEALPPRTNGEGAFAAAILAMFEASRGRLAAAESHIADLMRIDAALAHVLRAGFAMTPFIRVTDAELRAIRAAIVQTDSVVPPGTDEYSPALIAPLSRIYTIGALSARLGELDEARARAAQLDSVRVPATWRGYASTLARSLRARIAIAEDRPAAALRLLETVEVLRPPDVGSTPADIDRYLRIELLLHAGRPAEALQWLDHGLELAGSVAYGARPIYHAIGHVRRAEALEQLGNDDEAIAAYTRFLELWRDADPEYDDLMRSVRQRRDALLSKGG